MVVASVVAAVAVQVAELCGVVVVVVVGGGEVGGIGAARHPSQLLTPRTSLPPALDLAQPPSDLLIGRVKLVRKPQVGGGLRVKG